MKILRKNEKFCEKINAENPDTNGVFDAFDERC